MKGWKKKVTSHAYLPWQPAPILLEGSNECSPAKVCEWKF